VTHKELQELLPGYALNALASDEARVFEAHLADCNLCQRELAALREVTATLAQGVPMVEPPTELGARILGAVRPSRPSRFSIPRSWVFAGVAAAAVIIIAFAGVSLSLYHRFTELGTQVAAQERILVLLANPSARSVTLTGQGQAGVRLLYTPERHEGILVAANLDDPGPDFVYQLWLIAGQEPESAGVFRPAPDRRPLIVPVTADFTRYGVIAITRERGPLGVRRPTSSPILIGKL
jgi:anti-sigma-K factor RskA